MGKIMLNEIDYSGGNANVIRLTQAEYDALPPSKLTDNNVYMITDVNGDGSQFQPVIYSEDEREIGVWTDGKPLYERVFNRTSNPITMSGNSWYQFAQATEQIECISATLIEYENGAIGGCYPALANYNNGYIQAMHFRSTVQDTFGYLIIRYIKTTDTAGSGTWTPQGVPVVHYSTDEKVVGTWVDGSTIYSKTLTNLSLNVSSTSTVIDTDIIIQGADKLIECKMWQLNGKALKFPKVAYFDANENNIFRFMLGDTGTINIIYFEYTKTSQGGN